MKKDLAVYATALAGSDSDLLMEIMDKKHKKLKALFKIVSPFSDDIKTLEYDKETDADTLKVKIHSKKKLDMGSRSEVIEKLTNKGYDISHKNAASRTVVTIVYKESD